MERFVHEYTNFSRDQMRAIERQSDAGAIEYARSKGQYRSFVDRALHSVQEIWDVNRTLIIKASPQVPATGSGTSARNQRPRRARWLLRGAELVERLFNIVNEALDTIMTHRSGLLELGTVIERAHDAIDLLLTRGS